MWRILFLTFSFLSLASGKEDPVQWTLTPASGQRQVAPGAKAYFELKATIADGWHLYSPTTPPGGPNPTKIALQPNPAITAFNVYRPSPVRKADANFGVDTETYSGSATFLLEVLTTPVSSGDTPFTATTRYQSCTDEKCLPPVTRTATTNLQLTTAAHASKFQIGPDYALVPPSVQAPSAPGPGTSRPEKRAVQKSAMAKTAGLAGTANEPFLPFLLTAFGFGLAALFTPCVFPMIPITVSFFLNQSSDARVATPRRGGWKQALVFCLGIIFLFTALGFLVTAITGPFGVVQLGSSPWVNSFIAVVFFTFGLSLLGAFELRLPSGLLTSLNNVSQGEGYVGTLLMGLTFSLTSFACIGPIVGPLLIASVQTKGPQPVLGMMAFATGLAAPFFLLALFPSYLAKLPRSGGWMARVKVVLGFIVLAVMLKYLSNVDQVLQTHLLTRDRFLAAWIVLFALPGLYLLGILPMEGNKQGERLGTTRTLIAAVFLIFAVSLIPGLFNERLGDLEAYIPEPAAGTGPAIAANTSPRLTNNLEGALAAARESNKLVLVNFTGYACTNCHWMKANMFPRPEIVSALQGLVVVDLFTDGTDAESEKNQKLEDTRFGTASIPFYAILDGQEHVVATFPQLTRNPKEFLAFLESKPGLRTAAMLR